MTRRDQARAALTTPPARTGPATSRGPAIVGNTDARERPRRTRIAERKRDGASPTWGSIEPCPTQTSPSGILTPTRTRPRAALVNAHDRASGSSRNTKRPGRKAIPSRVLTATARGKDAAHRAAVDAGHVPEQRTWTGLVKSAELSHDTAVYRAALDERARIEAEGGRVVRVRLDAELKSDSSPPRPSGRAPRAATARPTRRNAQPRHDLGLHDRQPRPGVVSRRAARHRGRRRT